MKCKVCKTPVTGRRKCYCSNECFIVARRKRATRNVTEWRRRLKLRAIDYRGGCCERCGYNKCESALEFHHTEPSHKDFSIAATGNTRSWERVQKELDKCILVCANCHREIHAGFQ